MKKFWNVHNGRERIILADNAPKQEVRFFTPDQTIDYVKLDENGTLWYMVSPGVYTRNSGYYKV